MTKARDIASAIPAPSTVSSAELGYLDGVTSAIQTQIDTKQASSTAVTLTGTQTLTNKTLTNPVIASVINNTLTSTTGDIIYASGANTPARLGIGSTGNVLTVASGIPSWAAPAGGGKVLQVVYASYSTATTITSNGSYRDTGLSATITPTLNTSKVLIFTNIPIVWTRPSRDGGMTVRLLRGSTSIFEPSPGLTTEFLYFDASAGGNLLMQMPLGLQYLDSPATTSATTYKQQFNNTYGTSTATAQSNGITSTMILMEIGA
jgi:hypothetical protein